MIPAGEERMKNIGRGLSGPGRILRRALRFRDDLLDRVVRVIDDLLPIQRIAVGNVFDVAVCLVVLAVVTLRRREVLELLGRK